MEINLEKTLSSMILSASGWRGIFASDGNEESISREISEAHRKIAFAAAAAFSHFLIQTGREGEIICSRDTRPTGETIVDAVINSLLAEGRNVIYPGICAAPEVMAYAKYLGSKSKSAAGFIYISASHNPAGYNGFKFGLCDGGVLSGPEAAALAEIFKGILLTENASSPIQHDKYNEVLSLSAYHKEEAKKAYFDFTREVITGCGSVNEAGRVLDEISKETKKNLIGIVADFNGSARALSIDREFMENLGVKFLAINAECGVFSHAIVPEGPSLDVCSRFLDQIHGKDGFSVLGYVPDCDGDRGNLVIYDYAIKQSRALEAQEVFALACIAELSYLVWKGEIKYSSDGKALTKTAVVVNDPTSLRIDRIAEAFGAEVFRAEVGEANVVNLARKLREKGWLVRILGEGSNGGNITHPSAVRDPLNTIGSILKLLCIKSKPGLKGLFEIWCSLSGQLEQYREDFSLSDVIASIPVFFSTGAFSSDAVLKIKTADQSLLKNRYQPIFLKSWELKKDELEKRYGIAEYAVSAYNGIVERNDLARFGDAGKGGLKICFMNTAGKKTASIWMRGSATEPVLRIMADAENEEAERELIAWQRSMIKEADEE